MKVLVIGSGGREHALCWKIAQSDRVREIYCAPGNGGIGMLANLVDIRADDIEGLRRFAASNKIDLTVVGPEAPLVGGLVDAFQKAGLRVFGPTRYASMLEGSKIFAKEMMKRWNIPTAQFEVFDDYKQACIYAQTRQLPFVVKADGLAAGKGVTVCYTRKEALQAIKDAMVEKRFGTSGQRVIIEDCLKGEEASIIVVSDGKNVVPLATSQDHKRVLNGDRGPNTGGMGAYSSAPVVTPELEHRIMDEIIYPIIRGMASKKRPYKGVLYAGIMVTSQGPKVLEFNVRFGDPEIQAILPRMKSDLVELMERSIDGRLRDYAPVWDKRSCVCVVMASGGYPGSYEKGKEIKGLEKTRRMKDIVVFHAGTKSILPAGFGKRTKYLTNGGRVLNVAGLGDTIERAIKRTYEGVAKITFENMHYRKDIGKKALQHSGIIVRG